MTSGLNRQVSRLIENVVDEVWYGQERRDFEWTRNVLSELRYQLCFQRLIPIRRLAVEASLNGCLFILAHGAGVNFFRGFLRDRCSP